MKSRPEQSSDAELYRMLGRRRAGWEQAFEQLYERYARRVYGWIRRLVGNGAHADDILQETYLRLLESADAAREMTNFRAYLFTIARNLCLKHLAREQPGVSLDEIATLAGPENDTSELLQLVESAIDILPNAYREALLLRVRHEFSYAEIAQILDVPVSTVRNRIVRARQKIQKLLGPHLADFRL